MAVLSAAGRFGWRNVDKPDVELFRCTNCSSKDTNVGLSQRVCIIDETCLNSPNRPQVGQGIEGCIQSNPIQPNVYIEYNGLRRR